MKGFAATKELAWHYTDATRLLPLLHSKALKPSLGIPYCDETPVVWLTRANRFEPMALPMDRSAEPQKQKLLTPLALAKRANGLLRIGVAVDARLKTFQQWKASVEFDHLKQVEIMHNAAIELGSIPKEDWLISRKSIRQARWQHVQIAFPEDVNELGVQTWSEWDLDASYTQTLLEQAQQMPQCMDLDCACCPPNQGLPTTNPLEGGLLKTMINKD